MYPGFDVFMDLDRTGWLTIIFYAQIKYSWHCLENSLFHF